MCCIAGARPRFFGAVALPVLDTDGAALGSERPHCALQGVRSNQGKGKLWLIIFNEFSVRKW